MSDLILHNRPKLDLRKLKCRLASVNVRAEKHGDENEEQTLAGNFAQVTLATKHEDIRIRLHDAGLELDDEPFLILPGCKVNGIKLTPQNGGDSELEFRVQFKLDEDDAWPLIGRLRSSVLVSAEEQVAAVQEQVA